MKIAPLALALAAVTTVSGAQATDGTYTVKLMTPEIAQKAVNAALADCRKRGYQVAVAVVDRAGVAQALIRDRFAGAHTPSTAINKGWSAVSFRTDTLALAAETQAGRPASGIRALPNVVAVGGGVPIDAGGSTVGAIGVSGAPSGEEDDKCAKAGVAAIRADVDL